MIRGETTFICTQCKNKFTAMDIEYHCMALSCPMPCPTLRKYKDFAIA